MEALSNSSGDLADIVCIHAIDGGVGKYRPLARALPHGCGVRAFSALAWIGESSPPRSIEAMALRYCGVLARELPRRNHLVLYGASSGGLIAMEMAQQMWARGIAPDLLVLGDTRDDMQSTTPMLSMFFERLLWMCFMEAYAPADFLDMRAASHAFWALSEDARIEYLLERLRQAGGSEHSLSSDAHGMRHQLDAYRRYTRSYSGYEPRPYPGRTLYVRGSAVNGIYSRHLRAQFCGPYREATVSGGHMAVFEPPGAARIAQLICEEIGVDEGGARSSTKEA